MCGNVGIAGKLASKDENLMKRLLVLDSFRGLDSTGFASVKNGTEVKVAKIASHPFDLFDTTKFKDALSGYNSTVFLGHNRSATRGAVNAVNAHPYVYDHIVGAHNGTLSAHTTTLLEEKVGEKFGTDSMALYANIAKFGLEETIKLLRSSVENVVCQDAWALVFYDTNEKTLNFVRNKERPMWYSYTKSLDKLIWASEFPMIAAAVDLTAASDELYQTPVNDKGKSYRFFYMEADIHYKFDLDELKKGATERHKPYAKKLCGEGAGPAEKAYTPFHTIYSHKTGQTTSTTKQTGTSISTGSGVKHEKSEKDNVIHIFADRHDPYAGVISQARFTDLAKYGCSWCQRDIEFHEIGCTIIERDDILLCPDCSATAGTNTNRVYVKDLKDAV